MKKKLVGYTLLAICTIFFSLACAMGKLTAAVQMLLFCMVLLVVL